MKHSKIPTAQKPAIANYCDLPYHKLFAAIATPLQASRRCTFVRFSSSMFIVVNNSNIMSAIYFPPNTHVCLCTLPSSSSSSQSTRTCRSIDPDQHKSMRAMSLPLQFCGCCCCCCCSIICVAAPSTTRPLRSISRSFSHPRG